MICAQKIKILKCQIKPLEFSPNIQYFFPLCSPKSYQAVKQGQTDAGLYQAAISAQVVMGSLDIQRVIVAKGVLSRGMSGV